MNRRTQSVPTASSANRRARQVAVRRPRQRFLIVCEGTRTEPLYFQAIRARVLDLASGFVDIEPDDIVIKGTGYNTQGVLDRAVRFRDAQVGSPYEYDQVWAVFDKDSFPPANFDNAIAAAPGRKIRVAWSNEAFELWYLLHFENLQSGLSRTQYGGKLGEYLGTPYRKNMVDIYRLLQERGDERLAHRYAARLEREWRLKKVPCSAANPCTTVFKLVAELNKLMN